MTPAFEKVVKHLKKLPGLGFRSAEKLALHLLVERPDELGKLLEELESAKAALSQCTCCGNIAEDEELCSVCANPARNQRLLCVVESIPDVHAMERSGSFDGLYHILHGKLSPMRGVEPQHLNLASLKERLEAECIEEIILGLNNDIESEVTCHYLTESIFEGALSENCRVTRIGFGLPSGGGMVYADSATLSNALKGRRAFEE